MPGPALSSGTALLTVTHLRMAGDRGRGMGRHGCWCWSMGDMPVLEQLHECAYSLAPHLVACGHKRRRFVYSHHISRHWAGFVLALYHDLMDGVVLLLDGVGGVDDIVESVAMDEIGLEDGHGEYRVLLLRLDVATDETQ